MLEEMTENSVIMQAATKDAKGGGTTKW